MTRFLRRHGFPLFGGLALVLALVAGFGIFGSIEASRMEAAHRVLTSPSDIRLGLTIAYDAGPIQRESWDIRDRDGISTAKYRVDGRNGLTIRLATKPEETTDVSFLFGLLVNDGIWDLRGHPPRGDSNAHYRVDVFQLIDGAHGGYHFEFTDPHYWATTGGHQMTIHLDPHRSVRDSLIDVTSTTLVEPRYQRVIDDFRAFGTEEFRTKVAESRARASRPVHA